jgi:hypothetical protein
MRIPSDPEQILELLSELTTHIRDGLEIGSVEVRDYFERQSRKLGSRVEINKPMANDMMRYHALIHLNATRKFNAPYYVENVPLNGLSFRFDWCHVKAYKGFNGEPPTAHNTIANKQFYTFNEVAARQAAMKQPRLRGIAWRNGKTWRHIEWERIAPTLDRAHFIYCWEADAQYSITRTQLVAPRQSGKFQQGVTTFWRKDVPHPILGLTGLASVNDVEEVDDLPVFFEDAAEEGDDD